MGAWAIVQQARAVYAPRPRSVGGRASIEDDSVPLSSGRMLANSREVVVAMMMMLFYHQDSDFEIFNFIYPA
jgi:hypothetical protein